MAEILETIAAGREFLASMQSDLAALNAAAGDSDNPIRKAITELNHQRAVIDNLQQRMSELHAIHGEKPATETPLILAVKALLAAKSTHLGVKERWLRSRGWQVWQQGWRNSEIADYFTLQGAIDIQLNADLQPVNHLTP